ncbi:hypothetical protein [Gulbenkiania mobilis]|uniref:hypothetical protein n=1 Tax=Gulbenkiania mobilis TaxID=397457 RepID=UPI001F4508A5|nr:hypothetical protein [Gulbenkiania mobilis]
MDAHEGTTLLAEFADHLTIGRENAQGDFRTIIRKYIKTWQSGVGYDDGNCERTGHEHGPTHHQASQNCKESFEHGRLRLSQKCGLYRLVRRHKANFEQAAETARHPDVEN